MTKDELREYRALFVEASGLTEQIDVLYQAPETPHTCRKLKKLTDARDAIDNRLLDIEKVVNKLSPQERNIIRLYYFDGFDWASIAKRINYSERHVRRLRDSALQNMAAHVR